MKNFTCNKTMVEDKRKQCDFCRYNFVSPCPKAKKVNNEGCEKFQWN